MSHEESSRNEPCPCGSGKNYEHCCMKNEGKLFPDAPPLEHVEAEMVQAMRKAGIHPALIYAFEKTGRLVTEENRRFLTDADIAEWEAAIEEYGRRNGDPWER